ncbi:DUF58 domain-containing protein [Sulfurimonas sp. SAG-AH-194-C20]|nr:DUF58 domain-containing protein [Sulfurimonas sp. SAG-AH-194-C20]MDF1878680.1 DUF58 domain-containing protein [Sulfurimonas sp. SAG-AH-194-C20]
MYQYLKDSSLAPLLIKAQKSVFSSHIGENSTFFKGLGSDFVELREYTTGDDIKHIDWIISAKMNKPHVKVFQEEKALNIVLVSLLNASLNFGTQTLKIDRLKEIMALLAFASVKQQDAYESYIYTQTLQRSTKRSKHIFSVREMLENIHALPLLGTSINYKDLSAAFNETLQKKSLVFLVGDFLDTQMLDVGSLAYKHDVVLIIVRDRFEEEPLALGKINITDPQTGLNASVNIDKSAVLKIKKKSLEDDAILFDTLHKNGVRYLKIYTDEEPLTKLLVFMSSL